MARKPKGDPISAWVNFDKPLGMTSTQAVSKIKWLFNAQKAGHAGTLDPLATGILPIALGEATKTVPYLMDADKIYRFTISFGVTTDSFDGEGKEIGRSDKRPEKSDLEAALKKYIGQIEQIPPAFSAIMVDGKRAYDLAREGIEVELKARLVDIYDLVLESLNENDASLLLHCGKGTYVRALCRDICTDLGVCGHITKLRRERVGAFETNLSLGLEILEEMRHKATLPEALLPVETALDDIPALRLTTDEALRIKQGRTIFPSPHLLTRLFRPDEDKDAVPELIQAFEGKNLRALLSLTDDGYHPHRVFHL